LGGKKLDFEAVLAMLRDKALALESRNRQRYLRVIEIDATKPENFRALAKKPAKSTKSSIAPNASKTPPAPSKRAVAAKQAGSKAASGAAAPAAKPKAKATVTTVPGGRRKSNAAKKATMAS
jgi:hypothetical protein